MVVCHFDANNKICFSKKIHEKKDWIKSFLLGQTCLIPDNWNQEKKDIIKKYYQQFIDKKHESLDVIMYEEKSREVLIKITKKLFEEYKKKIINKLGEKDCKELFEYNSDNF